MAFFSLANARVVGISAAVPENKVSNYDLKEGTAEEIQKLVDTIGIETRRLASETQCASDLCVAAANKLIEELKWDRSEIETLFFITQTPDHTLPGTSLHLQERLSLPKSCVTFDINQGCAGYVYGLSLIASFMGSSGLKKGLLLVGDTISKLVSPHDKSLKPIFSDCGTATALVFDNKAEKMDFNISSEGKDYEAIIVPEGGSRTPIDKNSDVYRTFENDIKRKGTHLAMKGLDVFNFSLKKVAPNVETLLQGSKRKVGDIDYFVFHQANRLILESISKKLMLDPEKVPSSLKEFGNTSGATIPLTIVSKLSKNKRVINSTMLLAGFGVGLSLASSVIEFKDVICPELIEM